MQINAPYRDAAWLLKRHAISVLPSVASLKALRQLAKTSSAPKSYVAFGNPLLLGPDGSDTGAWDRQQCPKNAPRAAGAARGATPLPGISVLFRGNLANVAEVQKFTALPETTDELDDVQNLSQCAGRPATSSRCKSDTMKE